MMEREQIIEGWQGVKSEYETFIGGLKFKIDAIKAEVKADTVRKMVERLHEQFTDRAAFTRSYIHEGIDKIAKDMMEETQDA